MMDVSLVIETAVRSVPGVVTLYSPDAAVSRVAKELLPGTTSLVVVGGSDLAPTISVSVAVDGTVQAPATAALVAAAIRAALPPDSAAEISVRISRVTR